MSKNLPVIMNVFNTLTFYAFDIFNIWEIFITSLCYRPQLALLTVIQCDLLGFGKKVYGDLIVQLF